MTTKRQHYVPQTYLKAWETDISSESSSQQQSHGFFLFEGEEEIGKIRNKDSVLWLPRLYTIGFDKLFIAKFCPKVYMDFVDKVNELMQSRDPAPVYGKMGHSQIYTKASIRKHLDTIDDWEFYYFDGTLARKKSILADVHGLNSYIIEDGLDNIFEKERKTTFCRFINEIEDVDNWIIGTNIRTVGEETALSMIRFFFMMMCRSPYFDGLGIYTWVRDSLLSPVFGAKTSDEFVMALWYSELYRMLFKESKGHFHLLTDQTLKKCQMILFKVRDDAGHFITSDNPAFRYQSVSGARTDCFLFPISPMYLLMIAKGNGEMRNVDFRLADSKLVRSFNRRIERHKTNCFISTKKNKSDFL